MRKLSLTDVYSKFKKRGFTLLSKRWDGAEHDYRFRCDKCGQKFIRRYYNMHTNSTCPHCKSKTQYNKLNIEYWVRFGNNVDLTLLDNVYVSARTPMRWKCNICNYIFSNAGCNVKAGSRCPKCARQISKNEELIREYMERKTGLAFPNMKPDFFVNSHTGHRLELDGYCEELKMAFEYDGEQHFNSIECWGGDERLLKTQQLDLMKDELCERYGIRLLRINYKNINDYKNIVDNFLKRLNF